MKERVCETCSRSYPQKRSTDAGRFCGRPCYHEWQRQQRKTTLKGPRRIRRPEHELAPPSGLISESRIVLFKEIGPGPHTCRWCLKVINWELGLSTTALVVDHLDFNNQNNLISNLVPSCVSCNGHRRKSGDSKIIQDGELTVTISGVRRRAAEKICEWCEVTFLAPIGRIKIGKARFHNKSCARYYQHVKKKSKNEKLDRVLKQLGIPGPRHDPPWWSGETWPDQTRRCDQCGILYKVSGRPT